MEYGRKHTDGSRSGGQPVGINTIDWNDPLVAVHRITGERRPITQPSREYNEDPEMEGSFAVEDEFIGAWNCFDKNGNSEDPDKTPWDIRNVEQATPQYPPELLEALRDASDIEPDTASDTEWNTLWCAAKNFLADLPQAVDPDLELAREVIGAHNMYRGEHDDVTKVVLAAIKRVRAEKG